MNGSSGATVNNNAFYHLIDGKLVAFEVYTNDAGTWYYASGDNCDKLGYDSMQVISESEVYSEHPDTMGGIEALIFDEGAYLFSEYSVSEIQPNSIAESYDNKCGDNAYWELDENTGVLTISGTGEMYDYGDWGYDGQSPPWCTDRDYGSNINSVIIEEGITGIGEMSFLGSAISSVQLPESLKTIGMLAFHNCENLKKITIPKNVIQIDDRAFGQYGNSGEGVIEGFTVYGYAASVAQKYVEYINNATNIEGTPIYDNKMSFISLDDFEEIPEAELTEEEKAHFDFINHHVGIAKLEGERDIWQISKDIETLVELAKFDYYYGNTGIGFATDAYANLGNPKEIFIAGQKSRDIYSSVSDTMYYQALLSLLYDCDESELFDLTKSYYITTLKEISEFLKVTDLSYGTETNIIQNISKIIGDIIDSETFTELAQAIKNGDDSLKLFDLPIKNYKKENLSVGAGDVISLISSAVEIGKNAIEGEINILNCVVYFQMFRDLQNNQKDLLEQMYSTATDDNATYKEVLKNIKDCISVPDIDTFILKYIITGQFEIGRDSWTSVLSVGFGMTVMKLADKLPGGIVLPVMDITGQLIDTWFDKMNSTEQKIASIGEIICYLQIAASLKNVGEQYRAELIEINSFQNATKFHNAIYLYYQSTHNLCEYGNLFLDLFISSYYSLDIGNPNKAEIIANDNLVFKYIVTSFENSQADDYLNDVFGLSNGDYFSWYKEIVVLNASIKDLHNYYNQAICCIQKTEEEICQMLEDIITPKTERVVNYIKNKFSNWTTTFIGCPVSTDVFNENGELVATIKNGNITVHNADLFMNIFCYTLDEYENNNENNSHGTLLMTPSDYTFTVTAQKDCNVMIQQTNSNDLSGIILSNDDWKSNLIKLKQDNIFQLEKSTTLNKNSNHHSWIMIALIIVLIALFIVITIILVTKNKSHNSKLG